MGSNEDALPALHAHYSRLLERIQREGVLKVHLNTNLNWLKKYSSEEAIITEQGQFLEMRSYNISYKKYCNPKEGELVFALNEYYNIILYKMLPE